MSYTAPASGWKHHQRLTEEQGRRICAARHSDVPVTDLARRFGVNETTIRKVIKGEYVFNQNS